MISLAFTQDKFQAQFEKQNKTESLFIKMKDSFLDTTQKKIKVAGQHWRVDTLIGCYIDTRGGIFSN